MDRATLTLSALSLTWAVACSGSVDTVPADKVPDETVSGTGGASEEDDTTQESGGALASGGATPGAGGESSGAGDGGGGTSTGTSGGSPGMGGQGGSPGVGAVTGELHFAFAGMPFSNTDTMGVQVVSLVPRPENTTVTADLGGAVMTTGVAGSMVFLLSDCIELPNGAEECTLEVVSFGASPSSMGAVGDYPFDGRLGTFAKQETFTTSVIREAGAWRLPPTNLGLILDATTNQGTTTNQNNTGSGPDFITVENPTGTTTHRLWIESFDAMCDGDSCAVNFSAYQRE